MLSVRCLLLVLLVGPVQAENTSVPLPAEQELTIRYRSYIERCFEMQAGQALRYRFKSSNVMDFDIHYHKGEELVYLVKEPSRNYGYGTEDIPVETTVCMSWVNRSRIVDADLSFEAGLAAD